MPYFKHSLGMKNTQQKPKKTSIIRLIFLFFLILLQHYSFAQSTTILPGGSNTNIQVTGNASGISITGITTQQRDAIVNPAEGYTIYNKTTKCTEVFNGSYWFNLCDPNPQPSAAFAMNINALSVVFTNNSTKALNYSWDFGDGNTSSLQNPTHTYATAGNYTVLLKVSNNFGQSTSFQNIAVAQNTNPVANFSFQIDKKNVQFTNLSQNGLTYLWTFGNGSSSTQSNPSIAYNNFGTYSVTLQTTNNMGSNSVTKSITLTDNAPNTVTDIDGNVYNTVTIGSQIWMKENLNTTKFKNGETIPNVIGNNEWAALNSSAWCRYNNNPDASNELKFGLLYNGFTAQDARGVCPNGWRVPTVTDFNTLIQFLGGPDVAGGKLKQTGIDTYWNLPNNGATNETGFTALPSGNRLGMVGIVGDWRNGYFGNTGTGTYLWTKNLSPAGGLYWYSMWYDHDDLVRGEDLFLKTTGNSIRCIKE